MGQFTTESVVAALGCQFVDFHAMRPPALSGEGNGLIWRRFELPMSIANVVAVVSEDVDAAELNDLLDRVSDDGLPHLLMARPRARAAAEVASSRGMTAGSPMPLMATASPIAHSATPEIRALAPDELAVHAGVAARGFGAPPEMFDIFDTPEFAALPSYTAYVAEVAGEPVTTGLLHLNELGGGIGNIATPPEHQRKGYGAAITSHLARLALEAGAPFAYLQSSPSGYAVYERLGFTDLEHWPTWTGNTNAD